MAGPAGLYAFGGEGYAGRVVVLLLRITLESVMAFFLEQVVKF